MTRRASARRYARALFDVAKAEGSNLEQVGDQLTGIASLVAGNDQLARVLVHPAIPADRKRAVVEQLLARSPVEKVLARTLLLLADRDRLVLLSDLAEAYRARLLDHLNIVQAEVTTAVSLSQDRQAAMAHGLASLTGRTVQLDVRVDPSLLGGAVARIGSTVYDGSVATQLTKLKERLVGATD